MQQQEERGHDHQVARKMKSSALSILLNPEGLNAATALKPPAHPTNILYLNISPLSSPEAISEECDTQALQGITKALAKTLQKLHLLGATLAAYGEGNF